MKTQLSQLKSMIEDGESCVYAYEQVNLTRMSKEDPLIADKIFRVLELVGEINKAAGIE